MPAETLSPSASPSPATRSRFVVSERSYPSEPSVDRHDFLQLVLPERGRLEMQIGGERGRAEGVRFALVPSGVEHRYWASGPNRFLILDLASTLIAEVRERLEGPGRLPAEPFPRLGERLAALATLLRAEMATGGLGDPLIAETLGLYAGSLLFRDHLHRPGPATADRRPSPAARQLALRTRDYLDAYYLQPLSIGLIADAVGFSASHMQRAFRHHFGETIVSYLQRRRLMRARDLLCATDLAVTEIAFASGFNDHAYFTRLFTREIGLSPSGFRASMRAESDNVPR